MDVKRILMGILVIILISGCAESSKTAQYEPQVRTYVIDPSQESLKTFIIDESGEKVDLDEAFKQDRAEIESYREYRAIRNQADREKEERERLECYEDEEKDPEEYYLEECED